MDLDINFPEVSRLACPTCGEECAIHDSMTWRRMEFFPHEAYLHAHVPRVKCAEIGMHQVPVPWTREGSQFTLLFEALIITVLREMPVLTAARRMVGKTETLPRNQISNRQRFI